MMSRYCINCGTKLEHDKPFCHICGAANPLLEQPVQAAAQAPTEPPPVQTVQPAAPPYPYAPAGYTNQAPAAQPYMNQRPAPPPVQKKKTGLFIGIGAGAVILIVLVIVGISGLLKDKNPVQTTTETTRDKVTTKATTTKSVPTGLELIPFPDALVFNSDVNVTCNYQAPEVIIPANYRSMEYIVYLQCWTDRGSSEVLVSVEIPGFTQKYEQKITATRAETEISIHPPLLDNAAQSLNSSKDAQINVTITDLDKNKIIVQDTRPVKLYSRFDMQWQDAEGTPYYENILAWVTPEAEEIRQLLRLSADSCNELTEGALDAIVGYQQVSDWSQETITYVQVFCMMHALSSKMGVKYVMAPFSATSTDLQRVATPAEVINTASGLCAETAVTIASAIQATNMHAVLILLPGHMQVAVETWQDSGQYFLIETTALDAAANQDYESVIDDTMTAEDWSAFMAEDGVVAIDCNLASQLHIQSID